MSGPVATTIIVGPEEHGVVRHAMAVGRACRQPIVRIEEPLAESGELNISTPVAHWHYTDRLFGCRATAAAERFVTVASSTGRRRLVTLHDVPEPGRTDHARRRVSAYRMIAGCVDAIVVASEHERQLLRRCEITTPVHVVPLPIDDRYAPVIDPAATPRNHVDNDPHRTRVIGVLGFLYPGKGHLDVVRAAASVPGDVVIEALGRPSEGHHDLVAELHKEAARLGRRLSITGFLTDDVLSARLASVDVPVVAARSVSASASLCTWIGAGRRPLVARAPYATELAATGDLMTLYDPDESAALAAAVLRAVAAPPSTWRHVPVPVRLSVEAVAHAHVALYTGLASVP